MPNIIRLQHMMDLKGGENSHLTAELLEGTGKDHKPKGKVQLYSKESDIGKKARLPGWINIGDISACLRTSVGLGDVYKDSRTPYIVVGSKHTRPVIIAKGCTQLEATIKAIAGDLNSPFGGVWGFNTPVEIETARFLDKVFLEAVVAPGFERGAPEILSDTSHVSTHRNRFLMLTGEIRPSDLDPRGYRIQQVAMDQYLKQGIEPPYDPRSQAVIVTGNNGNTSINSLPDGRIDDIGFAGNAAIYLSSNLVFFVHNGAIAGLGDGKGSRVVAARNARMMLEDSAYAALSAQYAAEHASGKERKRLKQRSDELWDAVLYDTPFTREDFASLGMPLSLIAFSDAFYPKIDGFIETAGLDRIDPNFGARKVTYTEDKEQKTFIPKKNNYDPDYDRGLIPGIVVQPGGSLGDKLVFPMAQQYGVQMVLTMSQEQLLSRMAGNKETGRRFFGHVIM